MRLAAAFFLKGLLGGLGPIVLIVLGLITAQAGMPLVRSALARGLLEWFRRP